MAEIEKDREPPREYRIAELAEAAGISVRTVRFYRERRLLPPPRKAGRIAWYGPEHLARLRLIAELLDRGHALGGIAELIGAGEDGRDVAELIGLQAALVAPWSDETPVHLSWDELRAAFGEQLTEANTAESLAQGYITVDADGITHISRRLMDATVALVDEGVPLAAVLEVSRHASEYADAMADVFVALIRDRLLGALTHVQDLTPPKPPASPTASTASAPSPEPSTTPSSPSPWTAASAPSTTASPPNNASGGERPPPQASSPSHQPPRPLPTAAGTLLAPPATRAPPVTHLPLRPSRRRRHRPHLTNHPAPFRPPQAPFSSHQPPAHHPSHPGMGEWRAAKGARAC
ncbi:MerR family transcriptional regulator [Kitasatospora cheerisanensis]|uniref:MerR family transcriptional regulator n=1 Tax=Kitasatospora cheerisanensis TaxID=81942 RepID=UPI00313428D7